MAAATPPPDFTFASDNTAGLIPEVLSALAAANAGSAPSYGSDDWTGRARKLFSEIFEKECDVHFLFNGTAANALTLAHATRSFESIVCHEFSHVDTDECGAPEYFSGGSKVITVRGPDGKIDPVQLAPVLLRGHGIHYPRPGVLSLTQATEWGTLYTPAEISALTRIAREHGMRVHLDGARFANAAAALRERGVSPADFTWRAGVDVLCFGGTKNGMLSTEAVIFFQADLARDFAYRVKQGGQLASKQRFAAAQWCAVLESGAWLRHAAHANAMARRLADGARRIPGISLVTEPPVNGVFLRFSPDIAEKLWARGWQFYRFIGEDGYRFMHSWATSPEAVDRLLADLAGAAK